MRILNFGSLNLDLVYQVANLARPGETVRTESYTQYCGGKGLNQSIAMAKAGLRVCHAGCVGTDGEPLLALLEAQGVDTRFIRKTEGRSGHAVIQVDAQGENCILLYGGANHCITEKDIDQTLREFSKGDWLVLQNELSRTAYLLEQGKRRGMQIVFNPAPFTPEVKSLPLRGLAYLFVNETEGRGVSGEAEPEKIAQSLAGRYQTRVVLTLGGNGSVYCDGSQCDDSQNGKSHEGLSCLFQPGLSTKVVDTTGAGDTFSGYFLRAVMDGRSPAASLELAARAAALTVSRSGAAQAIPTLEELGRV